MAITLPASITGASQTGFTDPVYTTAADVAPDINGKQVAVTAIGGTQTGVTVHSVSSPFTVTFYRPKILKRVGVPGNNGYIANVQTNNYKLITRKGVLPLAGQPTRNMNITTLIEVPAGADTADMANIRAAISAHVGTLNGISPGLGDTLVSGIS